MKQTIKSALFIVTAFLVSVITACTKDDDAEITQAYSIMLSYVCPYDMQRYMASDSLVSFITDNMGLEKDTVPNSWLVRANGIKACDRQIISLFESACSMVDPELYAGKYSVSIFRYDNEEGTVNIAEKEFVATFDNGQKNNVDNTMVEVGKDQYIYHAAISYGDNFSQASKPLIDNGYSVITGNLNNGNGNAYICIGVKIAKGNANTAITGSVTDEFTGEMVERALTAREAAISCIICVQGYKDPPKKIRGAANGAWGTYEFERFEQLGRSDGNTNQSGKGTHSYLYFSRSNNQSMYLNTLGYFSWNSCPELFRPNLVRSASYYYYNNSCDVGNVEANLNAGAKAPLVVLVSFID